MKQISLLSSDDQSVRTQITLTTRLKERIEATAERTGISLSEFLRRAALAFLEERSHSHKNLKELADNVIGSVDLKNHPTWKNEKQVIQWVKSLRHEWE